MIHGMRVKQAREVHQLTQLELAERVGISQSAIAQIENGTTQPTANTLEAIAFATRFPPAFFRKPPVEDFPEGSLSLLYRARASARSRDLSTAHAWAVLEWELVKEMMQELEALPVHLPRLPGTDPVMAARITRSELGLSPDTPLDRVLLPVERAGVLVLALPIHIERFDAFSVWAGEEGERPVIAVSRATAGDRLRFSVAHELGHLVLHSPKSGTLAELERQADQFAAEFLLPEEGIRRDVVRPVTLATLTALKPIWRVSIASLVRRVYDLGIVTQGQYRQLMKQISARGWRKSEPENLAIPPEKPRAMRKMVEVVCGIPIDYDRLAASTRLLAPFLREILDAHAEVIEKTSPSHSSRSRGNVVQLVPAKRRS